MNPETTIARHMLEHAPIILSTKLANKGEQEMLNFLQRQIDHFMSSSLTRSLYKGCSFQEALDDTLAECVNIDPKGLPDPDPDQLLATATQQ